MPLALSSLPPLCSLLLPPFAACSSSPLQLAPPPLCSLLLFTTVVWCFCPVAKHRINPLICFVIGNVAQPLISFIHSIFVTLYIIQLLPFIDSIPDVFLRKTAELRKLKEKEEDFVTSERQELKNKYYIMKMNYQSQKNKYLWRIESHSHDVLIATATHQYKQEAKDKEIFRLQAAAALQEREAEPWCLKIQYETMRLHTGGGDVHGPSSSSL
ncbi:hypothetical protein DEU56DRAFT_908426 [Suillus clintonianus]|uniref:uncharacterized protein n=1 Tax=Suillus clintonianus TaxID=1904413 RepID=UPI001B87969B|nr:uncharacterized protein DEU56DRAFT_908426 [Suillus clintonianus]KAG2150787.1 hypothetical protein DEU56DRAFT_908426 [Suillus clintonianus]